MKVKTIFTRLIITVLIAAMALSFCACGNKAATDPATNPVSDTTEISSNTVKAETVGEGTTEFKFKAVLENDEERLYTVKTDAETVGEALVNAGLIEGDEGEFGLYVKAVCGVTADYDTDGQYWAFYIDGEYAATGVDLTDIDPASEYMFKLERA